MSPPRVRFAPSPTGELHLGGARTALINALFARAQGGAFVLRIEDTDLERNVPGAEERLQADLEWLGIVADESPSHGGPCAPYRQSERLAQHVAAFERLEESGRAYPCFCPPDAKATRGCPGGCFERPRPERSAPAAGAPAWRFRLSDDSRVVDDLLRGEVSFVGAPAPDPVIVRADGRPTFLFASVIDDADQGITHVIRGEDHLPNAWKQVQMLEALGRAAPRYGHLPLILGIDRTPLSKRHGRTTVGDLREAGYVPEAVVLALAHLGMTAPVVTPGADPWPALVRDFSFDRLNKSPAVYDQARMDFLSAAWIRALPAMELARRGAGQEERARIFAEGPDPEWWPEWLALVAESRVTLGAALVAADELLRWPGGYPEGEAPPVLDAWREMWPPDGLRDADHFAELSRAVSAQTGALRAALLHPLRVALTGSGQGPALKRLAPLIDRAARVGGARFEVSSCVARIARARAAR